MKNILKCGRTRLILLFACQMGAGEWICHGQSVNAELITYNQAIRVPLTPASSQFGVVDWDRDGRRDLLVLRSKTGVQWHQNLTRGDDVLFAGPAASSLVLKDERVGRGMAIFDREGVDGAVRWIVSVEQFQKVNAIGTRPLAMHAWRQAEEGFTYVGPQGEKGEPYAVDGDVWISPTLEAVDWTGDGRTDLLMGVHHTSAAFPEGQHPHAQRYRFDSFDYEAGRIYLLENISRNDDELRFAQPVVLRSGVTPIRVQSWVQPRAIDLDRDGLLDLVLADHEPGIRFFLNKGAPGDPQLVESGLLTDDAGKVIHTITASAIEFADIAGDERLELVVTSRGEPQYFRWYSHEGDGPLSTGWKERGYLHFQGEKETPVVGPGISTIEFVDWNEDGVHDLLLGAEPGTPMLVRNTGTESERRFEAPERLRWEDGSPLELYAIDTGAGSSWGPIETHFERILPRSAD